MDRENATHCAASLDTRKTGGRMNHYELLIMLAPTALLVAWQAWDGLRASRRGERG
jgi:hypothetical protein